MPTRLTTPDQILKAALQKEMQARDFYADLAARTSVDFVQDLLRNLQNEESKHVRLIQAMLGRLEAGKPLGLWAWKLADGFEGARQHSRRAQNPVSSSQNPVVECQGLAGYSSATIIRLIQ